MHSRQCVLRHVPVTSSYVPPHAVPAVHVRPRSGPYTGMSIVLAVVPSCEWCSCSKDSGMELTGMPGCERA